MAAATKGTGVFFDSQSSRRQPVAITLEGDAIAIAAPDGTPIARWPYANLERVPAPQHRLRLGLVGGGSTARLGIPDPAFAETVKERLGVLTVQVETSERRKRHRVVEWTIAAVAAILLLGVVGMPSLTELLLPLVPLSAEEPMGRSHDAELREKFKGPGTFECGVGTTEKEGEAAFQRLVAQLEAAAALPVRLRAVVVRAPKTINATAAPGGYVHVYQGLVDFAETPAELAGVLAHELGHVAHRDATRGVLHGAGVAYLFGVALGDFFGSGALYIATSRVLSARHTRYEEAAADAYGVALLTKMGGDPRGIAQFFEHLTQKGYAGSNALFATHPMNKDRIAAISAAPGVANPRQLLTADEWRALKDVCSGTKGMASAQ